MAAKDGISVSSIDSNKECRRDENTNNTAQQIDSDEDISTITLATDNKFSMLCKYEKNSIHLYICTLYLYIMHYGYVRNMLLYTIHILSSEPNQLFKIIHK